ncbi:MAG TPA: alanine--tRNA ligase-related protein, partial [archaeon]|nr:alanine--tRNA ligase-related protein [archaeon]
ELVNHVFMQFTKNPSGKGYGNLPIRVNDTGWGHERLVWFANGTQMGYDSVFPAVVQWLRKQTGVKPDALFGRYAKLAGGLDFEERNAKAMRARIAKELGVEAGALQKSVAPMQAIYAIADHVKTLLFAVTDGGIPSNVGGGYNLRVLLRRAFAFSEEHGFKIDLAKVAELHAKELAPLFPELRAGLPTLADVLAVEQERYRRTVERGRGLVLKAIERGSVEKEMGTLFVSHGVTPELVEQLAAEQGVPVSVPEDFYTRVAEGHAAGEKGDEEGSRKAPLLDAAFWLGKGGRGLPATELAYYETPYEKRFESKVVAVRDGWIVLERTLFYPEGGGQPADRGWLAVGGRKVAVVGVQKAGGVVLHKLAGTGSATDGARAGVKAKEGDAAVGEIDWEWRYRLMKAHTGTHLMAGAARHVIGSHVWQAGAQKGYHSSRLDLTHYRAFTPEEVRRIEGYANSIVKAGRKVEARFLPRGEAERKYGFVLYQGGASPGKIVRVVKVSGVDVECCGGTHLKDTKEIGRIKIVRSERLQDGVNRLEYAVAEAAEQWESERKALAHRVALLLGKAVKAEPEGIEQAAALLGIAVDQLEGQVRKFANDVAGLSGRLGQKPKELTGRLAEATDALFAEWKELRKKAEHVLAGAAKERAEELARRAKGGEVRAVVEGERKELIEIADRLVAAHPELTVVLANVQGEVVGMSRTKDVGKIVRRLCEVAGGKGGGSAQVAQGRGDARKLKELLG